MKLLDRYILRTVATPLVLALGVAAMLLLLEKMLRLFDFVLAEQGPISVVWRMLANLLPHYFSLALPLGTLLGVMLAFRQLSMSSELDAISSSGASFARLLRPVYGLCAVLMAVDFLLVSTIEPYARYEYNQITFDITSGALGIKVPAGEFIEITDDITLRLGSVNKETREAEDIFIERIGADGAKTAITASQGAISTTPDMRTLLLRLEQGRQVIVSPGGDRLHALNFSSFDLEVDLPDIDVFRARGGDEREATFTEILTFLNRNSPASAPRYHEYQAELHWRIIHPLSFIVIPILAIATGVTGRRRHSTLKPVLGVAVLIVYHELLEEWARVVAGLGVMSPYASMWGTFVVFLAVSVFLYAGSIEQARSSKVMSRRQQESVRLAAADVSGLAKAGSAE